jgi:hypothetical protein
VKSSIGVSPIGSEGAGRVGDSCAKENSEKRQK